MICRVGNVPNMDFYYRCLAHKWWHFCLHIFLLGALFGDPHFITLDGVEYTFNGYGEYTILNANNAEFLLQGRMQPLPGGQGVKSPATGFTAFAMMQTGSSRIQVSDDEKMTGQGTWKKQTKTFAQWWLFCDYRYCFLLAAFYIVNKLR